MSFEVVKIQRLPNNLVQIFGPDNTLLKSSKNVTQWQANRGYIRLLLDDGWFEFNVYALTSLVNIAVITPYGAQDPTGTPIETYMIKFQSVYTRLTEDILAACCCDGGGTPGEGTYEEVATYGDLPSPGSTDVLYYVIAQNAYYYWDGANYVATDKVISGTTSGTDTYTLTGSSTVIGYSQGVIYKVRVANANTGPATLNWDGVGAAPFVDFAGSPLAAGRLTADSIHLAVFDGTSFRLSSGAGTGIVMSVNGPSVDNTDPLNPIVNVSYQVTRAQADLLIAGGGLVRGISYLITDAAGPDLGLFLKAISSTEFELAGHGIYLNPDYQGVGVYTGVMAVTGIAYTSTEGVWFGPNEVGTPYSNGMVVFWDGLHYQVTDDTAFDGTNPIANTAAYTVLPKSAPDVGYIQEVDFVIYDYAGDIVFVRWDKRLNKAAFNAISGFQWGNDACYLNTADDGGVINCVNQRGQVYACRAFAGQMIFDETHEGAAEALIVSAHGVSLIANKDSISTVQGCIVGIVITATLDVSSGDLDKYIQPGISTFEVTIDITGLTTLDLTGFEHCGIINLISTNPTESIDTITNAPIKFPFRLIPEDGLTVTVVSTSAGSAAPGDICLENNTNVILVGRSEPELCDDLILKFTTTSRQVGGSIL